MGINKFSDWSPQEWSNYAGLREAVDTDEDHTNEDEMEPYLGNSE